MDGLDEPPALRGRWTICAMLFVATTINYMDRQVLSILKPVLHGQTTSPAAVLFTAGRRSSDPST